MLPPVIAFWDVVFPVLLILLVAIPIVSVAVMTVFAYTADFRFVEAKVRDGGLRGAIAAAIARVIVRDADHFHLPLVIVLEKTGVLGQSTPLFGGATVRDIEWRIYLDDEHVSTVTEARSTHIDSLQKRVELPVNAEIHMPRGLVATYREYRRRKRASAEIKLTVRGHVIVRHWWMNRQVPVRVTRHIVVGDAIPHLAAIRWHPLSESPPPAPWTEAELDVRLANPYRDEVLKGKVTIELRAVRRLLADRRIAQTVLERVRIRPGRRRTLRFMVRLERAEVPPQEDEEAVAATGRAGPEAEDDADASVRAVAVTARVLWDDERLAAEEILVARAPGEEAAQLVAPPSPAEGGKRRLVARVERIAEAPTGR